MTNEERIRGDTLFDRCETLQQQNDMLIEALELGVSNAESVIFNMEKQSKENAGVGFCVKDEERFIEIAKQALNKTGKANE